MTNPSVQSSPALSVPIEGYAQEIAVTAAETIELKLSGADHADLSLVRLIQGDPNPEGPGYMEEAAGWARAREVTLDPQQLQLGSYVEVPDAPWLTPGRSLTLALWVHPTRLTGNWQALAAKWAPQDFSYGLFCAGHRMLVGAISHNGGHVEWCTGRQFLEPNAWQFVALIYDAELGNLTVHQYSPASAAALERATASSIVSTKKTPPGPLHRGRGPLLFGALIGADRRHWAHFNGKLAGPILFDRRCDEPTLDRLRDWPRRPLESRAVGAWDFSREVPTAKVVDVSKRRHDGHAVNAPGRAVTGPFWSGTAGSLYTDDPSCYDAIYLHDDDLDDANWDTTCAIPVPEDARPGIYAARVATPADELIVPVVVTPRLPRSKLCVLLPTLTWQAYSSNRAPYSFTEDGVVDRSLCLYDFHSDGTMVNYCTRRKPTRSGDPRTGIRQWGAHTIPANLYLIDWLERLGHSYDVLVDQQLHERGTAALAPYSCVVLGSHAEYWTSAMLDALEGYLSESGRVLSLGGNGLYWVTSLASEQPFVMEVRKSGDGDYEDYFARPVPGEAQHSTTLEVGGMWARRGRPARKLVGVEHSANVFVEADGRWGFERLAASYEDRFAFIFDGIDQEVIGNFGRNLGSAAGYEMDSVLEWAWTEDWRPTVLARAVHEAFIPPMRMPVPRACDIAMTASPRGAAVFAAGSVTWTGSLSHNGYDNNVSRLTDNVLRRFMEVERGEPILRAE